LHKPGQRREYAEPEERIAEQDCEKRAVSGFSGRMVDETERHTLPAIWEKRT